jgi:DNA-binding transcriptional ArsR family regulator
MWEGNVPSRLTASRDLADLLRTLAHADRIRLIEELRSGEKDVMGIADALELPPTRISQHLSLLRAHHLVEERREGRNHIYRLAQPALAGWIVDALAFVDFRHRSGRAAQLDDARALWTTPSPDNL